MSIKLDYLLQRNRITFDVFCKRQNIQSYNDMLLYCEERGFEPYTEEEFKKCFSYKKVLTDQESSVKLSSETKKPTRKRTSKKRQSGSSSAREDKKIRDSN